MNKLLLITLAGVLMLGCAAQEEVAAFHPTDDISAQAQGGKGHTADGSEVQLETSAPVETPAPVKAFHPTDDISSQSQGGKGHTSDGSEVQLP